MDNQETKHICRDCGRWLTFHVRHPDPEVNSSFDCPSGHRWRMVGVHGEFERWRPVAPGDDA